jgi:hypothetical protein
MAEQLGDTELPEPFRGLRVERVTKPDGRLLLYYSFERSPGSGPPEHPDPPDGSGARNRSGDKSSRRREG